MASSRDTNNQNEETLEQLIQRAGRLIAGSEREQNMPTWQLATMFSWHFETTTYIKPGVRGQPADPHIWIIHRHTMQNNSGSSYFSILGDRVLTKGIYYWEMKFNNISSGAFGFGVTSPPNGINDSSINGDISTGTVQYCGNHNSKITGSYACAWWFNNGRIVREIWGDNQGNPLFRDTVTTNDRIGLLLDLVKGQIRLYLFKADNHSRSPNEEVIGITGLMKGRSFIPIFSCSHANTEVELVIDEEVPTSISDYRNRITELLQLLEQLNRQLRTLQELSLIERQQHMTNYARLLNHITQLKRQLGILE